MPPFPDEVAFATIERDLGRPLGELFSSISERPVAAASLGQVRARRAAGTPAGASGGGAGAKGAAAVWQGPAAGQVAAACDVE